MAAETLAENDFVPSLLWVMVIVPVSITPVYMLTRDVELYTVVPLILQVTGPVLYQLLFPPAAERVQLMVDVLFATLCVAVHFSCRYLPSYFEVLRVPVNAMTPHLPYEYWI